MKELEGKKRVFERLFSTFALHFVTLMTNIINKADFMKTKLLLLVLALVALSACNNKKKTEEIASYAYNSEIKLSPALYEKVGSWIEEGLVCYGILAMYDDEGAIVGAKSIKAKTIVITEKAIKMKATETVSLAPKKGCNKLGLEKGDTWWENEGDLFQTKEEADEYVKMLTDKIQIKKDGPFTVD